MDQEDLYYKGKDLFELNEEMLDSLNELVKLDSRFVIELIGDNLYGTHPSLAQSFLIVAGHLVEDRVREKLEIYIDVYINESKEK